MKEFKLYDWKLYSDNYLVDESDEKLIKKYYTDCKEEVKVRTDLYPEPYIGNIEKAKVIILASNPGLKTIIGNKKFNCEELKWYNTHPEVKDILQQNLVGKVKEYPYYYLNENIKKDSPGHDWLEVRTKELQEVCTSKGLSIKQLSERIACIQFFPYHSVKIKYLKTYLPSQEHNFKLLKWALDSGKLVICARGATEWNRVLDKYYGVTLNNYSENVIYLNSYRNIIYSTGNMRNHKIDFDKIIKALK